MTIEIGIEREIRHKMPEESKRRLICGEISGLNVMVDTGMDESIGENKI